MVIATERQGFLSAWRYRDYRLLWVCTLGIYIGQWIEAVVLSWLVLELTNSPFLVGFAGGLPLQCHVSRAILRHNFRPLRPASYPYRGAAYSGCRLTGHDGSNPYFTA
jgi:hypothetical protein